MEKDDYYPAIHSAVAKCLQRASVRVVCDEDDEDTILGWAAFEGPTLHYIFVRKSFRRNGIAKALLEGLSLKQYANKPKKLVMNLGLRYRPAL